jgi:soluble lytic murein transglycosylase-like protein
MNLAETQRRRERQTSSFLRASAPLREIIILLVMAAGVAQASDIPEAVDPELRAALAEAVEASDSFVDRFDAEVWLLDMSQRLEPHVADTEQRLMLLRTVHYEATRAGLAPELVLSVIDIESRFDRFAVSYAGAQGLMQIMGFWLDELDVEHGNLFDMALNIRMGCTILKHYLDRERGDLPAALARYNGSTGQRWYSDRVLTALSERWYRE